MVACGGVNAARVHLGHINSTIRDSSSEERGGTGVGDDYHRDSREWRGGQQNDGSLLELIKEHQR